MKLLMNLLMMKTLVLTSASNIAKMSKDLCHTERLKRN